MPEYTQQYKSEKHDTKTNAHIANYYFSVTHGVLLLINPFTAVGAVIRDSILGEKNAVAMGTSDF